MRLPNGYGSIYKLKGKRRKPWCIRVNGIYVGYAKTKKEALSLLADYHQNPITGKGMTFSEVWELFLKEKAPTLSKHTVRNYTSRYKNFCKNLYNKPYNTLQTTDFYDAVNSNPNASNGSKNKVIAFLRSLDRFAFEHNLINQKATERLQTYSEQKKEVKVPFSEEEIKTLWANESYPDVDLVLILLYTGLRSGELAKMRIADIHFEKDGDYMIGGFKTEAGTNRYIPIHPRIKKFIEARIKEAKGSTLLNFSDKQLRVRFKRVMEHFGMVHTPHECRHTFISLLSDYKADPTCSRKIVGHAGKDVTDSVYTHKTHKQLQETIRLIP